MLCTKILVAYDSSDLAKKSLEKAIEIANMNSFIQIHVLHVMATIPAREVITSKLYQKMHDELSQRGQEILSEAQSALASLPNKCQCVQMEGAPARVILDYIQENNCDLIIMGSRGLSGFKEFLGSVSHTVIQQSKVPILLVK
ncbi:universal stress protein UspA-like protein [Desulfosporosinus acidiphilus SJ4]|uniref:Universal stress protein UspA-like protein n=1 Tax=Desulfosporosinus acidiphilus (strain DSM 22704 / JCM 16185 / SJ4) TaxID=646529 RepID=I4D4C4_DESAJ|nr:universal stress protein [Desulfosporosinus acidiphilus]AFM40648.1 universal stress protein UspA-like protein [Desulfosporosinus acidiphilus SJ4]